MRYAALVVMCLYAIIGVTSVNAGAIADSISYQGQLTDASDNPVPDGPKDLILSIWTDSVGGAMLHSEVVVAATSKGLFSTCIGCGSSTFPDIFNGQTLFLQTQMTGQPPISPRTRLRAVPYSMSASSVHGEATNGAAKGRGIISVKSATGPGSMTNGLILLDVDSDGDGVAEASDSSGVSEGAAGRRLQVHNLGSSGEDGVEITAQSAGRRLAVNNIGSSGNDGVEIQMLVNPSKGDVKITASQNSQSLRCSSSADSAAATTLLEADLDGDGVMESSSSQVVNSDSVHFSQKLRIDSTPARISTNFTVSRQSQGAEFGQQYDQNGDGLAETEMSSTVERKSGSIIYLDREGNEVLRAQVGVDSTRGILTTDRDSDGDGVPEDEAYLRVEPGRAYHAIKTKGTGADANRVIGSTDDSTATVLLAADSASVSMRTKRGGVIKGAININHANRSFIDLSVQDTAAAVSNSLDLDGDGVPEQEISQTVLPTTSSVAIKTKGTGADKDRVISSTTDTSKAVTIHAADTDGDGLADRVIREQCDDDDASITVARGSSEIKIRHKGWDGTIKGRMAIEQGGAIQVDFAGDGFGFVSQRFGVGVLTPTHPIEHSSGAHLTAGGVWTNASDAGLKENFQPVDGQELLEKIAELSISQWNYRSESDEVKHIGPTAQDFKETFGVGSDGRSISTIDPSGIALAAIKELNRQNQDLKRENENLKKQLEALARKVESLAVGK